MDTGRKYRTPIGDLPSVTTVVGWRSVQFLLRGEKRIHSKAACMSSW